MSDPVDLWRWRRAATVRRRDRIILAMLIGAGFLLIIRFADWWFRPAHVGQGALFVLLTLALWYGVTRIILGWIALIRVSAPPHVPAPTGATVAIFTTSSPGEPLAMFEKTLAACARVTYPHTTYLLDDTRDPAFAELARQHGAVHLELVGIPGAKAGKINAALERTTEEFILVLDPDHIPFPMFLDRVIGHFSDERIGFVQVAQAYYNQTRSFTARAAAEQTYIFYGPTQMGLHGHGAAVAIGANCTFRRAALATIGGHGIGLAEDLVTAIRLHARGWRSSYVPEVLSRGLVPEDIGSFYKQQLKWARGVYEVAFSELPRAFRTLTWRQRLSYATIGTYYMFGITTLAYLVIPYLYLWTGVQPATMRFEEFISTGVPVALIGIGVYAFSQRWLCHPEHERGLHWRGLMLKMACWWIFLMGTVLAIAHAHIPYIPTAKEAQRGRFLRLAAPHLALLVLYLVTLGSTVYARMYRVSEGSLMLTSEAAWAMLGFATFAVVLCSGGIQAAWSARTPPTGGAWDDIDVTAIAGETA
ncbi:MAG TPA: glycosyltransferase family 2 protein [Longimicrobiales bacterium]|nr:glycosyltransferase family 2 protein [Longimicrobiales bacterium]